MTTCERSLLCISIKWRSVPFSILSPSVYKLSIFECFCLSSSSWFFSFLIWANNSSFSSASFLSLTSTEQRGNRVKPLTLSLGLGGGLHLLLQLCFRTGHLTYVNRALSSLSSHIYSSGPSTLLCFFAHSPSGPSPTDSSSWAASWETTVIPEDWGSWLTSPFGVPSGMITSPCFCNNKKIKTTHKCLEFTRWDPDVTGSN